MKSKITIDLDYDNHPVIRVIYLYSEDVRDKMVNRFLEAFGHNSSWCKIEIMSSIPDGSIFQIRPINNSELEKTSEEMNKRIITNT